MTVERKVWSYLINAKIFVKNSSNTFRISDISNVKYKRMLPH